MSDLPTLITARLRLRSLRPEDAVDQYAYARDPEVAGPGMWEAVVTLEANEEDIRDTLELQGCGESMLWGIEHAAEGRLIGRCGFFRLRPTHRNAELGYALARPHWGRGYMSKAVAAVMRHRFGSEGLHRIEAVCLADNTASIRVLEKAGFVHEGTAREAYLRDGAFCDLRRYALLAVDWAERAA